MPASMKPEQPNILLVCEGKKDKDVPAAFHQPLGYLDPLRRAKIGWQTFGLHIIWFGDGWIHIGLC